jgi:hypothetical protein
MFDNFNKKIDVINIKREREREREREDKCYLGGGAGLIATKE